MPSSPSNTNPLPHPNEVYSAYDDLHVVGRSLPDNDALTLTAVMRNEMYFLPSFFEYYRKLGIERFVILEDQSTDDTLEFLNSQPDCMVLHSSHAFNDSVELPPTYLGRRGVGRMRNVWVNLLLRRYAMNRWSVHVDADEFLRIPEGKHIQDLLPALDTTEGQAVWSLMIDLYPASIDELHRQSHEDHLDLNAAWYFDARQHSNFRSDGRLRYIYGGSRARLMDSFGVRKHKFLKSIRAKFKQMTYNLLQKPTLVRLPETGFLYNNHRMSFAGIQDLVLPLEHYKFTGQLIERTKAAIERVSHYNGSEEYHGMQKLLNVMTSTKASFLTLCSSTDRSFATYERCQIAQGTELLESNSSSRD